MPSEMSWSRDLEDEHSRLKRIAVDLTLDRETSSPELTDPWMMSI